MSFRSDCVRRELGAAGRLIKKQSADGILGPGPSRASLRGFDHEPTRAHSTNFPYRVPGHDAAWYTKEVDYVDYIVKSAGKACRVSYEKISARLARQAEIQYWSRFVDEKDHEALHPPILA